MSNDTFYFKLFALMVLLTVIGVLTYLYSVYIAIFGGIILALCAWRFLIAPSLIHTAEARRLRAESEQTLAQAEREDMEAAQVAAMTAQINAQTAILQQESMLRMLEAQLNLRNMPAAYRIQPNENGLYPQFIGGDGRLVGYVPTQIAQGKPAALPPGYEQEPEGEEEIAAQRMYKLSDMLRDGAIQPNERESLIGFDSAGKAIRGALFLEENNFFNSMMLVADQGGGKSAAAALIAAYTIYHGGNLLVIDPDFDTKQSLTNRLGPLAQKPFLLAEIGTDPESADRVLNIAELEMQHPGDYPLILIVDESTMIFRHLEDGGKWAEVGKRLAGIAEDYSTRGRKRRRRVILLGQAPQARRTGQTTVRDNLDLVCFKLKLKKARLLWQGMPELIDPATHLQPGEGIVIPAGSEEDGFYKLQFVYADAPGLEIIAAAMLQLSQETYSIEEDDRDTPDNVRAITPQIEWIAFVKRVAQLRSQGVTSVSDLSRTIFGVSRGGSARWPECKDKIESAIAQIERDAQMKLINGGR